MLLSCKRFCLIQHPRSLTEQRLNKHKKDSLVVQKSHFFVVRNLGKADKMVAQFF